MWGKNSGEDSLKKYRKQAQDKGQPFLVPLIANVTGGELSFTPGDEGVLLIYSFSFASAWQRGVNTPEQKALHR